MGFQKSKTKKKEIRNNHNFLTKFDKLNQDSQMHTTPSPKEKEKPPWPFEQHDICSRLSCQQ